ncbi:MAG: methionine--tRNA ligase subunit beta [Patescibacteria group bacterium]|nr:methionine--tRNA ligase subunit beta [Patescibacteria group bacterium]MDE2438672.1 methionine--tRNA ligase subunit beta [Patescibacteria group bacterium]
MSISYEEFKKVELRVAKIVEAARIEGSEKLLKLKVDIGTKGMERQIVAGIGKRYDPEVLLGKEIIIVANLEPRILMGFESQGMLLAANGIEGPVILGVQEEVSPGSTIQ